jgi:hypothetical protein
MIGPEQRMLEAADKATSDVAGVGQGGRHQHRRKQDWQTAHSLSPVMPGLMPGIYALLA